MEIFHKGFDLEIRLAKVLSQTAQEKHKSTVIRTIAERMMFVNHLRSLLQDAVTEHNTDYDAVTI